MIKGQWYRGTDNLSEAYSIRSTVFVEEQNVPKEIEFDAYDRESQHLVVFNKKEPVATGRLTEIEDGVFKLSRIAVIKAYRGRSIGDFLVRMMVRRAFDFGANEVFLNAQTSAIGFYKKLGFEEVGDIFYEADIEHIRMTRDQDVGGCCCQH